MTHRAYPYGCTTYAALLYVCTLPVQNEMQTKCTADRAGESECVCRSRSRGRGTGTNNREGPRSSYAARCGKSHFCRCTARPGAQ